MVSKPATTPLPLLAALAKAIRIRRKQHALTIKELAAASGLSERFLVSVEAGKANISVVKLASIAHALDTTAATLLEGAQLTPHRSGGRMVALLGLRGAGKTAIGKRVAARLDVPFVELDALIADHAGMTLEAIFTVHGAEYYRRLEREQLLRLVEQQHAGLLATGGGLVTNHAAFERLKNATATVFLNASADDHWNRVIAQGDARPMADSEDAMAELRTLLRARRPLYEQADFTVDTTTLGLERSVDTVVRIARKQMQQTRGDTGPFDSGR
ncbi:MAG: shikimate kinase [Polyangiaceae bacterium]